MIKKILLWTAGTIMLLITIMGALAVPQTVNIQGELRNSTNDIITGNYDFSFNIYNASTGGTRLLQQNVTLTVDSNGVYNHILSVPTLNFEENYWLTIEVDSDGLMSRINLSGNPYAHITDNLDNTKGYTVNNLTLGSLYLNDITIKPLTQKNANIAGPAYGLYMTGPSGQNLPHWIVQSGGSSQASTLLRSMMIVNEISGFHNTTGATDCQAYMDNVSETLKIDCNTTTSGADILVGDDAQIVGDVWLKDTDGEWHFMTKELELNDELRDFSVISNINITVTGTELNVSEAQSKDIIVNLNEVNYDLDKRSEVLTLTNGSNTTPTFNHIYYNGAPNPILTKSTTEQSNKADVMMVLLGTGFDFASVSGTSTSDEFIRNVYWDNFKRGAFYDSGFGINVSTSQINISEGTLRALLVEHNIEFNHTTSGEAVEIHSDGSFHIHNNDLNAFDSYSTGNAIGNNKYFGMVCGVALTLDNTGTLYCIVQDEPSSEHSNSLNAELDDTYANFFPADSFVKRLFIPVVRVVMQRSGGVNTIQTLSSGLLYEDVRGKISSGGSPPTPSITSYNDLSNIPFTNNVGEVTLTTITNNVSLKSLFVDNTNSRVGINTAVPDYDLDVNGSVNGVSFVIGGVTITSWDSVNKTFTDTNINGTTAGSDLSGTYPNPSVVDDSHNHTSSSVSSSADLVCTDCIGTNEISDVYVLNTGDSIAGNLTIDSGYWVKTSVNNGMCLNAGCTQKICSNSTHILILNNASGVDCS